MLAFTVVELHHALRQMITALIGADRQLLVLETGKKEVSCDWRPELQRLRVRPSPSLSSQGKMPAPPAVQVRVRVRVNWCACAQADRTRDDLDDEGHAKGGGSGVGVCVCVCRHWARGTAGSGDLGVRVGARAILPEGLAQPDRARTRRHLLTCINAASCRVIPIEPQRRPGPIL